PEDPRQGAVRPAAVPRGAIHAGSGHVGISRLGCRLAGAYVALTVNQHVTEPGDPVPRSNRLIADDAFDGLTNAPPPVACRMQVLSVQTPIARQDRLRAHHTERSVTHGLL